MDEMQNRLKKNCVHFYITRTKIFTTIFIMIEIKKEKVGTLIEQHEYFLCSQEKSTIQQGAKTLLEQNIKMT